MSIRHLDHALEAARSIANDCTMPAVAMRLAAYFLDLFPSDAGCGAVEPRVGTLEDWTVDGSDCEIHTVVRIPVEWPGAYTAEEARGLARMLIVAAQAAEGK